MPALYDTLVRVIGGIFILAALLLASAWLTELTAPRRVAKLPAMPVTVSENHLKSLEKLFGASVAQSQSLDGLQLAGVFAAANGGGFATFQTRSGPIAVFPGDEVIPGIRLDKIARDHVVVLSAGVPKELHLREDKSGAAAPISQAPLIRPQPLPVHAPPSVDPAQPAADPGAAKTKEQEQ